MYRQDECEFWMFGKDACECIESNIVLCACIERMHANVLNRKDECALCLYGKNACECIERMNEHCECMGRVHDSGNLPYARQQGLSSHAVLRIEMRRNVSFRVFAKMFKQQILSASSKV